MRINEMNDQEKSALLAKAMGLELVPHPVYGDKHLFFRVPEKWDHDWGLADDFYHPSVMALAWPVAEWAWDGLPDVQAAKFRNWWKWNIKPRGNYDPQRSWLDKVLGLIIESTIDNMLVEIGDAD